MCKRKPGARCPSHARSALTSAQRRYDEAAKGVETALDPDSGTPPSRVKAAQQRKAAAQANLVAARVDYDATSAGRASLLNALADDSLPKSKRERLSARFQHAEALNESRGEQRRVMPDLPAERTHDMARTHAMLGESRDSLARVDAALATESGKREQQRLSDQRDVLTQRVFAHDVQYRIAGTGWRPNPEHVTPDEQRAARREGTQAQQALTVLSHQRAAVAAGGHDEKFRSAVADAEEAFQRRFMPEQEPRPQTAKAQQPGRPAAAASPRAGQQQRRGRGKSVLSAEEAKRMMRKAAQMTKGEKVTPGKHQMGPILPEPVY